MAGLRIVFMGTAELSCASLRSLLAAPGFQVVGVVTQPDRPKGRDLRLQATPVKALASSTGLPVLQPERARAEEFIQQLRGLEPELIAVAAYGQLVPQSLLDLPRHGCLNVHTSLLPRYRGAAPIQWAILNDDKETGVTIMKMDAGLDTGPIVSQEKTPVREGDTAETLHDRLAQMGGELLVRTIPQFVAGKLQPRPQPAEGVVYARKIRKEDGHIDWRQPARAIWNRVRGLVPWPGSFTYFRAAVDGPPQLLKLWQAEVVDGAGPAGEILKADKNGIVVGCGEQALRILTVQKEGGRRLTAQQFLAGHALVGCQLFAS
jgi:methionyl-tRNA formyltransferase